MKIEIWSDISCPFCYIGKRHLEAALQSYEMSEHIEIEWKSFLLDPSLPEQTDQNVYQMLAEKKGLSESQVRQMTTHVENMGKSAGLNYDFSKPKPVSTYKAHLLIQLAKLHQLGSVAEERLFKAYFMEGLNVADVNVLRKIGLEIGLSEVDLNEFLSNSALKTNLENDLYESKSIGISGVPFFLIDDKYAISGAQPVELFLKTLQKAGMAHTWEPASTSNGKAVCDPESNCK